MNQNSVTMASVRLQEMSNRVSTRMSEISNRTGLFQFSYFLNGAVSVAETTSAVSGVDDGQALGEAASALNEGVPGVTQDVFGWGKTSAGLDALIAAKSEEYGMPQALVRAVIECESGYDTQALSAKGAMGLMQLMPTTAEGLGILSPFDPEENIDGGIRYLLAQIIRFDGDIKRGLAAYNCGPSGITSRHITNLSDPDQFLSLPEETRTYLNNIQETLTDRGYGDLLTTNFFSL